MTPELRAPLADGQRLVVNMGWEQPGLAAVNQLFFGQDVCLMPVSVGPRRPDPEA